MSVYVDSSKWNLGRMKMCHMVADSSDELIQMAELIGVDKVHLQFSGSPKEHFDICKVKRELAISHGAIPVSSKEIIHKIRGKRQ